MSDTIEVITRFEHAFRAADQATIDELCDPGLVDHNPAPDHEPTLAGFKQKVADFKAMFPDLVEDLQDIIASGDTVATRWVVTGSLQLDFMAIPAAGQTIKVEGMNFYRLKDGRVTDVWTQFDGVALMQQLGALGRRGAGQPLGLVLDFHRDFRQRGGVLPIVVRAEKQFQATRKRHPDVSLRAAPVAPVGDLQEPPTRQHHLHLAILTPGPVPGPKSCTHCGYLPRPRGRYSPAAPGDQAACVVRRWRQM